MSAKADLRAAAILRRNALTERQRGAAGQAFADALADLLAQAGRVAAYVAVGTEPPTTGLLALCREPLLPVLLPDGDLDWAVASRLAPGPHGLLQPTARLLGVDAVGTCDVLLVPALAVDRRGNRLGRGGGSYDRALRRATGLAIAVLYDGEIAAAVPAEPHDVPVAAVVTPSQGVQLLSR